MAFPLDDAPRFFSKPSANPTRRAFLKRAACGAAALMAGAWAGCAGGDDERVRPETGVQTPTGEEPAPGLSEPVAECQGTETLSPQDLQVRQALGYVPETPEDGERCDNCRFYQPPGTAPRGPDACGGCQLFAGPVVAAGWCSSWAAQQS